MSLIHRQFWSKKEEFLDPSNGIPPDVTFVNEDDNGDQAQEVKAHKMFLGVASPVSGRCFMGVIKILGMLFL